MQLLEGVEGAAISGAMASLSAIAEYSERAGIQGPPSGWQALAATIQAARRGQLPEADLDGEGECGPAAERVSREVLVACLTEMQGQELFMPHTQAADHVAHEHCSAAATQAWSWKPWSCKTPRGSTFRTSACDAAPW